MSFEWKQQILSAYTGATLGLLPSGVMYILQDAVTGLHAMEKCGNKEMREKGCFWVITKSRAEIMRYPHWCEQVTVKVTSMQESRICTVFKVEVLDEEGNICISSLQELCVLDFERHRPQKLSDVGFVPEQPLGERAPFTRFEIQATPLFTQKVLPHMIDMSGHMNNVEYVKIAMDCFAAAERANREPSVIEAHYLCECKEGDELTVCCQDGENESLVQILSENKPVFEMKVNWREKK